MNESLRNPDEIYYIAGAIVVIGFVCLLIAMD